MPDEGWVPVANSAARDHRLSWRARGLLVELLSYPDGWETTVDKLVATAHRSGDASEGQRAMRTAMSELAKAGYVTYVRRSGKGGRWTTEIQVSDAPSGSPTDDAVSDTSVTDTSVSRTSEDRHIGDRLGSKNTDTETVTKTDLQRSSSEHSASLASLAVGADAPTDDDLIQTKLDEVYETIDSVDHKTLRNGLLVLEAKRKRIYRDARNDALRQLKEKSTAFMRSPDGALSVDRLSYKYAALHYAPDFPVWFLRPLGMA